MTLPPSGGDSAMPADLRNKLRCMFRVHHTHAVKHYSGTGKGARTLKSCEDAMPFDALGLKLAVQLSTTRPKILQCFLDVRSMKPNQKQQVEAEACESEDLVIQQVWHDDPAAQYHPIEAKEIAALQWASFVERSVRERARAESHASSFTSYKEAPEQANDTVNESVYLIRFNRRPKELHEQLANSPSLQDCREALRNEGFDWKLSSGPSVFVRPWQYISVVQALPEYGLGNSDVVVAESVEYLLEESLSNAGKGVWAKTRTPVPHAGASSSSCQGSSGTGGAVETVQCAAQEWREHMHASRTFLCTAKPLRNAASVSQSTTNSRMQPHSNPRRVLEFGWN